MYTIITIILLKYIIISSKYYFYKAFELLIVKDKLLIDLS